MHVFRCWKSILPTLVLAACSAGKEADPPPPPSTTVFDPLTQQMDRAQKVQDTVDTHAADTRKQVESVENGEASR